MLFDYSFIFYMKIIQLYALHRFTNWMSIFNKSSWTYLYWITKFCEYLDWYWFYLMLLTLKLLLNVIIYDVRTVNKLAHVLICESTNDQHTDPYGPTLYFLSLILHVDDTKIEDRKLSWITFSFFTEPIMFFSRLNQYKKWCLFAMQCFLLYIYCKRDILLKIRNLNLLL